MTTGSMDAALRPLPAGSRARGLAITASRAVVQSAVVAWAIFALAGAAHAQVERLPPVAAQDRISRLPPVGPGEGDRLLGPADRLALVPPSADGPAFVTDPRDPDLPYELLDPDEEQALLAPARPPGAKDGVLQWTTARKTFLLPGGANGFGMYDLTVQTILAFPFFTRDKPLLITPFFSAHILNGPTQVDMPPMLYDVSLEFRFLRQITPRLGADLAVAPGIYSDFHNTTSEAFRVTGRALALYRFSDSLQIAGGVVYLGWATLPVLPVGGFIWTPNEDWRVEAILPRPRVMQQFYSGSGAAWWTYVGGELGGNTYAILRAAGFDDRVTYRDYRVVAGLERKAHKGSYRRFEAGYVFGRSIVYESGTPSFDPTPTVMLRGELTF